MRAHQVLFASLWIAMGCTLSFAQAVTETKVLADFEDGTSGIFDKGPGIADSKDLTGKAATIGKSAGLSFLSPKVEFARYDLFRIDVYNPSQRVARMTMVWSDDVAEPAQGGHGYYSWINRYVSVRPGRSTLELYVPGLHRGEGSPKDSLDPRPFHWDKLQRFLISSDAEIQVDNIRLEKLDFPRDPSVRAFDFGPAGSPVILGTVGVTNESIYTDDSGFGWVSKAGLNPIRRDRIADSFINDWISTPNNTFSVKLPDGKYHLWMMWEDPGMWEFYQNYTDRSIRAGDKVILEERMDGKEFLDRYFHFAETEDLPGDDIYARYIQWRYQPREFDVDVTGGRLDLNFRGSGPYAATVNGLVIYPADKSEAGRKFLAALNGWRKHEFDTNWMQQLPQRQAIDPALAQQHTADGFILFNRTADKSVGIWDAPSTEEVMTSPAISLTASRGETTSARFSMYALADLGEVKLATGELKNEQGQALPPAAIKLQMVRQKFKCIGFGGAGLYGSVPWLLVDAPETGCKIPKDATRSFYVTATAGPDLADGFDKGALTLAIGGKSRQIELSLKVMPAVLPDADMGLALFGVGGAAPYSAYFPENQQRNLSDRRNSSLFARQFGLTLTDVDGPKFTGFKDGKATFDFAACKAACESARQMGFVVINVSPSDSIAKQILEDKGALAKQNGFATPEAMAKAFFGGMAEQAKAQGIPEPLWTFDDEPPDSVAGKIIDLHKKCAQAGGKTMICWSPEGKETNDLLDVTSVCNLNAATAAHFKRARAAGNVVHLNNQGANRWAFGLYMYKAHQAGVEGYQQFCWMGTHADPYYPLDSIEDDGGVVYPDREGNLRPVTNLVQIREGINDYRYTLALTRAIKSASANGDEKHKKLAADAKEYLDGVLGKIVFEDTRRDRQPQMTQAELDGYRAKVQGLLLQLSGAQ